MNNPFQILTKPQAVDPVCGMKVDPDRAATTYAVDGKPYSFCSLGCFVRFRAEPQRYLHPETYVAQAVAAAEFTCPMHPEVVDTKQSACPKCGMALEPVGAGAALLEESNPELHDMTRHRFHALCPYFAMFPESFAEYWIKRLTTPNDTVLDPFSGRGTTALTALLCGRHAISSDVNDVEFGSLGNTTRAETTLVWLVSNVTGTKMYIPITVNPITGIVDVGDVQSTTPAGITP